MVRHKSFTWQALRRHIYIELIMHATMDSFDQPTTYVYCCDTLGGSQKILQQKKFEILSTETHFSRRPAVGLGRETSSTDAIFVILQHTHELRSSECCRTSLDDVQCKAEPRTWISLTQPRVAPCLLKQSTKLQDRKRLYLCKWLTEVVGVDHIPPYGSRVQRVKPSLVAGLSLSFLCGFVSISHVN